MPLPRPHDPRGAAPFPDPPPSLPGMDGVPGLLRPGALARVAQRLGVSLAEVDRTMTTDEVLDECDLQDYLFDVDNPPADRPR